MFTYKTRGTCSREIDFDIQDDTIKEVHFLGGCDGNLKGICALVQGMKVDDAISKLQGIDCRGKGTSCPDQFAAALKEWKSSK